MQDTVTKMFRQLLERAPTDEERAGVARLMINLPEQMRSSPAAIADIILRAQHIQELEKIMTRASWEGQQQIHHDLPRRIDQAAMTALNKLRDQLPVDGPDRVRRLLTAVALWSAVVTLIAGTAGWLTHRYFVNRNEMQHQAVNERLFNECINSSEGAAMTSRAGVRGSQYDGATYRNMARLCAAEYADRRAGG